MSNDLTIEEGLTLEEDIPYGAAGEIPLRLPVRRFEASADAYARDEAQTKSRLSIAEKVMFGIAGVFTSVILLIGIFLTITGFIFSPIMETLAFGLMTAAFGVTLYVIWRGGR